MLSRNIVKFSPGRIILFSLLATIAVGTGLLMLPIAKRVPVSFIDALFTSTSITCVTGLLTVPIDNFTFFGKCIILLLMQIGGIGLITMTIFIMSLFVELGLGAQILAGKLLELESWKNIKKILFFIITVSLSIEAIGAFLIFLIIRDEYTIKYSIFLSLFHAISSFCDAGLTLFPRGMTAYQNNYGMLIVTSLLMLCGGLGFITWHEIISRIKASLKKEKFHFSLHSKIVLSMTLAIIVIASIIFWILEHDNTLATFNPFLSFINTLFNTISSRSTGFLTVNLFELRIATLFVIMIIAFIGSSPGSTGSGIKTTTFALLLASIKTAILGRNYVQIKGRRIARDQILKSFAILALSQTWILATIFLLLITENHGDFLDIVFESISAYTTLGTSLGLTPYLSAVGKIFIIMSMIVGRIGSLTFILALKKRSELAEYQYPEERVMLS